MQMDVFNTFIELLRQTGNVTKGQIDVNELRQVLPSYDSVYMWMSSKEGNNYLVFRIILSSYIVVIYEHKISGLLVLPSSCLIEFKFSYLQAKSLFFFHVY